MDKIDCSTQSDQLGAATEPDGDANEDESNEDYQEENDPDDDEDDEETDGDEQETDVEDIPLEPHVILIAETLPVDLTLTWPREVVDQLPDDLVLSLEGTEKGTLEVAVADAERRGSTVEFRFRWSEHYVATTLGAKAAGQTLVLWDNQIVDAVETVKWSAQLEDWLEPHPPYEVSSLEPGPGEDFVLAAKEAEPATKGLA